MRSKTVPEADGDGPRRDAIDPDSKVLEPMPDNPPHSSINAPPEAPTLGEPTKEPSDEPPKEICRKLTAMLERKKRQPSPENWGPHLRKMTKNSTCEFDPVGTTRE